MMGTLIIWRPLWASGLLVVCGDIIIHGSILQVNKRREDLLCFSVHHPLEDVNKDKQTNKNFQALFTCMWAFLRT